MKVRRQNEIMDFTMVAKDNGEGYRVGVTLIHDIPQIIVKFGFWDSGIKAITQLKKNTFLVFDIVNKLITQKTVR